MAQTVVCQGQRHKVDVREVYSKVMQVWVAEAKIKGEVWICRKQPEGYWKAVGRKAVPLDRR